MTDEDIDADFDAGCAVADQIMALYDMAKSFHAKPYEQVRFTDEQYARIIKAAEDILKLAGAR